MRVRGGIKRLPELVLPQDIVITGPRLEAPVSGIVVAVPSSAVGDTVALLSASRTTPIISAAKGVALSARGGHPERRLSEVLEELGWDASHIAVLSGPNLAHEVVRRLPAAAVVACRASEQAVLWQEALSQPTLRVYTSEDVIGVELAGALKNVIAIAAGAATGLGFGANAVATILTRGLAEISRIGVAAGADPITFQGLAGVGDLSATCFSPLSRNRRFGELLGRGRSVDEAVVEIGEAIEGVRTASFAQECGARFNVEVPISRAVVSVVNGTATVPEAMAALLSRPLRSEAASSS